MRENGHAQGTRGKEDKKLDISKRNIRSSPSEHPSERAVRLKIQKDAADHGRWRDKFLTRAVVYAVMAVGVFCVAVQFAGNYVAPETKAIAASILRDGILTVLGYAAGSRHYKLKIHSNAE